MANIWDLQDEFSRFNWIFSMQETWIELDHILKELKSLTFLTNSLLVVWTLLLFYPLKKFCMPFTQSSTSPHTPPWGVLRKHKRVAFFLKLNSTMNYRWIILAQVIITKKVFLLPPPVFLASLRIFHFTLIWIVESEQKKNTFQII